MEHLVIANPSREFFENSCDALDSFLQTTTSQQGFTRQAIIDILQNRWKRGNGWQQGWDDISDNEATKEMFIGGILYMLSDYKVLTHQRIRDARLTGKNIETSLKEVDEKRDLWDEFRKTNPATTDSIGVYWTIREMSRERYYEIIRRSKQRQKIKDAGIEIRPSVVKDSPIIFTRKSLFSRNPQSQGFRFEDELVAYSTSQDTPKQEDRRQGNIIIEAIRNLIRPSLQS